MLDHFNDGPFFDLSLGDRVILPLAVVVVVAMVSSLAPLGPTRLSTTGRTTMPLYSAKRITRKNTWEGKGRDFRKFSLNNSCQKSNFGQFHFDFEQILLSDFFRESPCLERFSYQWHFWRFCAKFLHGIWQKKQYKRAPPAAPNGSLSSSAHAIKMRQLSVYRPPK